MSPHKKIKVRDVGECMENIEKGFVIFISLTFIGNTPAHD